MGWLRAFLWALRSQNEMVKAVAELRASWEDLLHADLCEEELDIHAEGLERVGLAIDAVRIAARIDARA